MNTWYTVLVAVLVPVLWGLLSAWVFDRIRLRRECKPANDQAEREQRSK